MLDEENDEDDIAADYEADQCGCGCGVEYHVIELRGNRQLY